MQTFQLNLLQDYDSNEMLAQSNNAIDMLIPEMLLLTPDRPLNEDNYALCYCLFVPSIKCI